MMEVIEQVAKHRPEDAPNAAKCYGMVLAWRHDLSSTSSGFRRIPDAKDGDGWDWHQPG